MKSSKYLWVLVIIIFCVATQFSPAAGEGRSKEVVPGVYMIADLSFSISGYIVTDEGVVVVDTQLIPFFADEMKKEIKAITDKPIKYAINTHWHTDHVGGNEAFHPQAQIIAHEFTGKMLDKRKKEQEEGKLDESLKQLGEFKFTPPDKTFSKNMTLKLGGKVIELMFLGGGHTSGDIVVYLPKEKVLFSGDLFMKGSGMPDYRDDSNIDNLIASLKKMQKLDIDKIICGHIGLGEKKDIQASIDKLVAFRAQVEKYVDAKTPPEKAAELMKFPEGENPFYQQHFKKVVLKVYRDIKNAKK
jgi:glyoxylase-like metal-dependent hydrolase (beta-lactamase superfamily II)